MEEIKKRAIQELGIDTKALINRLLKCEIGEFVAYKELGDIIGRPVQGKANGLLQSARRYVLRERQFVFGTIHKQGLRRLNDVEKVQTSEHYTRMAHNVARKGMKVLTAVDNFDNLPNDIKIKHNTYASVFGALHAITTKPSIKKLEGKVEAAQEKLPLAKTLEAFKG